jgi:hypothetical protein
MEIQILLEGNADQVADRILRDLRQLLSLNAARAGAATSSVATTLAAANLVRGVLMISDHGLRDALAPLGS